MQSQIASLLNTDLAQAAVARHTFLSMVKAARSLGALERAGFEGMLRAKLHGAPGHEAEFVGAVLAWLQAHGRGAQEPPADAGPQLAVAEHHWLSAFGHALRLRPSARGLLAEMMDHAAANERDPDIARVHSAYAGFCRALGVAD
ncbi:hypothetical protein [Arenibaculum pallidiluteum]|uniref:hypothetical protein n=1 Tax=Arenibaculum pallidiluteum TaxID=2812559 RepID=UPI001A97130F|nr:hypothetical protein [Arenibaculum pallidiluteum]